MKYLTAVWNSDRFWLVFAGVDFGWATGEMGDGNWLAAVFYWVLGGILVWAHWDLPHMKLITMETATHFYRTKVVRR